MKYEVQHKTLNKGHKGAPPCKRGPIKPNDQMRTNSNELQLQN